MGGWQNPQTVILVHQQPDLESRREALATGQKLSATGELKATDTMNRHLERIWPGTGAQQESEMADMSHLIHLVRFSER